MITEYSLLTHALPTSVTVDGKRYAITTRACKVLQCFMVSEMEDLPIGYRMEWILPTMCPGVEFTSAEEAGKVYSEITKFMSGYPTAKGRKKNAVQLLSYEQDHALIVSAFRQAYGLDLASLKALHWWEFLALLAGLPDDTKLSQVINVRGMEMNPNDTPEQRQAKIKAKTAVAIRPKRKAVADDMDGEDIISMALSKEG